MRDITNFNLHINNGNEVIKASDINKIQTAVSESQKDIIELYDQSFKSKAFFALEHNPNVNMMVMDTLEDPCHIYRVKSENLEYNKEEKSVQPVRSGVVKTATFQTTLTTSEYSKAIKNVMVLTDDDIPKGCKIDYFVSTDGYSFYPVKEGCGVPTQLPTYGGAIYLKAKLYKNKNFEYPRIFAWAVLYFDSIIDGLSRLENIDLSSLKTGESTTIPVETITDTNEDGEITLVRDTTQNDKVVAIVNTNGNKTELTYNNGKLSVIKSLENETEKLTTLEYGSYVDSTGKTSEVLLKVKSETL